MSRLPIKNLAHDGYRVAGLAFAAGDNLIRTDGLTPEQLLALRNDPRLQVSAELLDDEPAAESGGARVKRRGGTE